MPSSNPHAVAGAVAAQAAATNTPQFLIVYASIVNGESWCSDCRLAEPLLQERFANEEAQRLSIHYAGDQETWRKPDNPWKEFGVPALPTLYKVAPDGTWAKLVEEDVYDEKKLDHFIASA